MALASRVERSGLGLESSGLETGFSGLALALTIICILHKVSGGSRGGRLGQMPRTQGKGAPKRGVQK